MSVRHSITSATSNNGNVSNATRYIITILVKYQKLNDTQIQHQEKQEILNELLNINAVELIDNFNITIDETISNDFETIYQMILYQISASSCNVALCKMIQRNNRDRITKYGISNIYYGIKDEKKIVILQFLDKMHCYFMHSFDFGLKFTKNETNSIYNPHIEPNHNSNEDPMLKQLKQIIQQKKKNIPKTAARFDDNRYVTKMQNIAKDTDSKQENNYNDAQPTQTQTPPLPDISQPLIPSTSFTFGKRWRYAIKYKNNENVDKMNGDTYSHWFVAQKYTNLKREMLSNALKKIPMAQWNQIHEKAIKYSCCYKMKLLKSYRNINYEQPESSIPNISQYQQITIEHIICILIYCNFTSIKNSLTDTYSTINKFEQWKDVKLRHSEYANFGRILTESIECFGQNNSDNLLFYHGLIGTFDLHSIHARYFVPTSMTTELSVVAYYCYNEVFCDMDQYHNGLIIGCCGTNDLKYFNCSFLSDFTNEAEIIFLGGKHTVSFNLIYNMKKFHNYQYYITAIGMIHELFMGDQSMNINMTDIDHNTFKKCVLNQIDEAHCIPSQIDYYLNGWCISRKYMTINMQNIEKYRQLLFECSLLLKYPPPDNIYNISIDSLCRLFPNVVSIKIVSPVFHRKCLLLAQILQFISGAQLFYGLDLNEIQLINVSVDANANETISSYSAAFFNTGWSVKIENNDIKIMKQRRGRHEHTKSTPNMQSDEGYDAFSGKTQLLNQSADVLIDGNNVNNEMYDNESLSNLTDLSQNNYKFNKVHIKMRIKKKNTSDIEIEFDFHSGEIPQQVANEMIQELELPANYKQEIVNVINAAIPNANVTAKNRAFRAPSHSKVPSATNVILVEFSYPATTTADNVAAAVPVDYVNISEANNHETEPGASDLTVIDEKKQELGPTLEQKLALQQQQTQMISNKHVRINNMPSTNIVHQNSVPMAILNVNINNNNDKKLKQNQSAPQLYDAGKDKKTVEIFNAPLVLSSFDKYLFPLSSIDLLQGKKSEFAAEYVSFLATQSQIYDLKLEHIRIQNEPDDFEQNEAKLGQSMQEKIELKRKELTGKWDEFVRDQKEINDLKQQISHKHLIQFKAHLHFENQQGFKDIIKSSTISTNDKQQFQNSLKDFRDQMINDYKQFRETHYAIYEKKLKQMQAMPAPSMANANAMQLQPM